MDRIYTLILQWHFRRYAQMAFLTGPRQVGKTTISKALQKGFHESVYLNWDILADREKILFGQSFIEDILPSDVMREQKPLIIFDEIHKYKHWKNYLKGFFDLYKDHYHILVTGSAHLDIYRSGGDSLMGRYFGYTVFPLTLHEIIDPSVYTKSKKLESFFASPHSDNIESLKRLFVFGGFPDPYLQKNAQYSNMWRMSRAKQLIFEDIQTLAQVHDVQLIEVLSELIKAQTGQLVNRTSIAKKIKVTTQTISRWLETLERFYYCFTVSPWHKNVTRSLIKEPKLYLWDWSLIDDEGARFENMVAVHLQKFVHFYTEQGYAKFNLYYLRDIDKKEVDFLITQDNKPYLMVEVKLSDNKITPHMMHFQKQVRPAFSLQVVYNMDFVNQSCFKSEQAYIVPALTLLSQLV